MIARTDAEMHTTRLSYDEQGNLLSLTNALGQVWSNVYDAAGQLVTAWNPSGRAASNAYDVVGNLVRYVDAAARTHTYEHDSEGRITRATDPFGRFSTREYDTEGHLVRTVDQDGGEQGWEYDPAGRLRRTWTGEGRVTAFEYDTAGRVTRVVEPDGSVHVSQYDAYGNKIRAIHPQYEESAAYDDRGRAVSVEKQAGEDVRSYAIAYDLAGRLAASTGPEGSTVANAYDELGRVVERVRDGVQTNRYSYDSRNRVVAYTDGAGATTQVEYDRRGLPTRKTYPDGTFNGGVFDAMGRLVQFTDARSNVIKTAYNAVGAVTGRQYFVAGDLVSPVQSDVHLYDAYGRMTNWSDGTYGVTHEYDDVQREVRTTYHYGAFSKTSVRRHDARKRTVAYTGADGVELQYSYGADGQLSSVHIPGEGAVTFNAYTQGRVSEVTYPGGTRRMFDYGPFTMLSNRLVDAAGNVLAAECLTADREDRLVSKETLDGEHAFQYAPCGRLATASIPGAGEEQYTYDAAGNRVTGPAPGDAWHYNAWNQLTNSGLTDFSYDAAGNMTVRAVAGSPDRYYEYDVANRLVALRDGGSNLVARYAYDYEGRRIMKDVGGVRTYFFYSDQGLVAEFDSAGNAVRSYGYGIGGAWGSNPLFMRTGTTYHYYINDRLGAPRLMVNRNGAVTWRATLSAFGRTTVDPASVVDNPLRFSSQYYDAESGLHYNTRRYFDPELGRYLSRDPVEESGGGNMYVFSNNDGINNIDPMGLLWKKINCGKFEKSLDFGVQVGLGAELSAGAKGEMCDCCHTSTGRIYEHDYVNLDVYMAATLSFGLKGKVTIWGIEIEVGFDIFKETYKFVNGRAYSNCGRNDLDFTLSQIYEFDVGTLDVGGSAKLWLLIDATASYSYGYNYRVEGGIDFSRDHAYAFLQVDEKEYFKASGTFAVDVLNELLGGHWVRAHIKDPFQKTWKGQIDETLSEKRLLNLRREIY